MHKGVFLLVPASDREDAESAAIEFLNQYKDRVWDWYQIGGRWSGVLNENSKKFYQLANEHLNKMYGDSKNIITNEMIKENSSILQRIWEDLGETTINPMEFDHYTMESYDDIVPLSKCHVRVKDWAIDMQKQGEEYFKKMLIEHEKDNPTKFSLSAYYAKLYYLCNYDSFSFESAVYDIENETNDPTKALEKMDDYWVVVIDMHN